MASKRSSSPLEYRHLDKRALLDVEYIQRLVDESVIKQMGSFEQLVLKDADCQKLRKKHEEVDCNCRRWHEFAVGLQSRVKRLAIILNKQQDAIKSMKLDKQVETANASVQTDNIPSLPKLETKLAFKKEYVVKEEFTTTKKDTNFDSLRHKPQPSNQSSESDIIDLTDDDSDKITHTSTLHYHPRASNLAMKSKDGFSRFGNSTSTTGNRGSNNISVPRRNSSSSTLYPPLPSMPLPPKDLPKGILPAPFQPLLKIRKSSDGIELSWDHHSAANYAKMESYELFVYQHHPNNCSTGSSNRWKKIKSDPIKAMPLPMACTLSQFSSSSKYYFAVRGRDIYGRYGTFSAPCCSTDLEQ